MRVPPSGTREMRRMRIESLGHVVIRVRDLNVAEHFRNGVLSIPIRSRSKAEQMTFFALGQRHDFAVIAICAEAAPRDLDAAGLIQPRPAHNMKALFPKKHRRYSVHAGDPGLRDASPG